MDKTSITTRLAERVQERGHDIPRPVLDLAGACVLDGVGNMLAGSIQPVGKLIVEFAAAWGGAADAVVIGTGLRVSAPAAALCNGTFHRALDFDNTWLPLDHPVAASHAALWSLVTGAHLSLSGRQFIECLLVGMEMQARIRIAAESAHHKAGAKGRGIFGTLAATAACCRALGLSVHQTVMAFGIAAGRVGGVDNSGTMANPADSGLAARNGVESALLAASGFTGRAGIIEAASGFAQYLADDAPLESIAENFARPWRLAELGVAFKKYPCQYPTHWGVDAVRAAMAQESASYDDVESVELAITATPGHTSFNERSIDSTPPASGLAGKFNVAYTAAAALRYGEVGIDVFSDEAARSPQMAEALGKVRVCLLPAIESYEHMCAEADITLRNGHRLHAVVRRPHGIWGDPLPLDARLRKFRTCASLVLESERVELLAGRLADLEAVTDMRIFAALLAPTPTVTKE